MLNSSLTQAGAAQVPVSGAPVVTDLIVSTARPLSHVVAETEADAVRARYVRAADAMLGIFRASDWRFVHADSLRTTRTLSGEQGATTDAYDYFAFGRLRARVGSDPNRYLFAGEPFEARRMFSHNRDRWLDLASGNFASPDPWAGTPIAPYSLSKYHYASGNPVAGRDPSGRFTLVELAVTVAVVSVGTGLVIHAIQVTDETEQQIFPAVTSEAQAVAHVIGSISRVLKNARIGSLTIDS
jgi:RHS repeat-associated protein